LRTEVRNNFEKFSKYPSIYGCGRGSDPTTVGRMEKMRALIANEPRVYREVISDALMRLRPLVEVFCCVEAGDLDREVARLVPHLVICSRLTESVRELCPYWVVLYPEGEDRAEIGGDGSLGIAARLLAGAGMDELLSVVDEAAAALLLVKGKAGL
jgi:hypothetical protein